MAFPHHNRRQQFFLVYVFLKDLEKLSIEKKFKPIFPPINLCSDNAAMIAWAGIEKFKLGFSNKLDFPAKARWPLDEKAPFLKGPGIKL